MGKFLEKIFGRAVNSTKNEIRDVQKDNKKLPEIIVASGSHICEEDWDGENKVYHISFLVNDSFRPAKSHAAEVTALSTYSPGSEYGSEEDDIYICIMIDAGEYDVIDDFKEKGTVEGASYFQKLTGQFLFKARIKYYDSLMYFYALNMCDGFWDYSILAVSYPMEYDGTEDEQKLIKILDQAAESYKEEPIDE